MRIKDKGLWRVQSEEYEIKGEAFEGPRGKDYYQVVVAVEGIGATKLSALKRTQLSLKDSLEHVEAEIRHQERLQTRQRLLGRSDAAETSPPETPSVTKEDTTEKEIT